jgi:hypothetical protein
MAEARANGAGRVAAAKRREDHWRGVLAEQRTSGLSHSEFCRWKAISMNAYFWWKREIPRREAERAKARVQGKERAEARKLPRPSLVPVRIRPLPGVGSLEGDRPFEVVLRGSRVIRVPIGFHAEELRRLVAVLEDASC